MNYFQLSKSVSKTFISPYWRIIKFSTLHTEPFNGGNINEFLAQSKKLLNVFYFTKKSCCPRIISQTPPSRPWFSFQSSGRIFWKKWDLIHSECEAQCQSINKSRLHRKYIQTSFIFTTFNRNSTRAIRLMLPSWYKCSGGETENIQRT